MAQNTCTNFCKEKIYNPQQLDNVRYVLSITSTYEIDETPNGKSSENRLRVLLLENLNTEQQL